MPILNLQRQFRELGRIRLGKMEGRRPVKLNTFRLTSPTRDLLDRAAGIYGGMVEPWKSGSDGDAWELITERDQLDIIVPPGQTLSQWNEMWGAGGCLRRCDGVREWIGGSPCQCPADPADRNELAAKGEACKPTTRLSVALPSLPDLGTWLLVSHGYYAAVELAGTYELLAASSNLGRMIPAILGIDHRRIKHQGQARKDITVPVIRLSDTITELMSGEVPQVAPPNPRLALPAPALPAEPAFGAVGPQPGIEPLTHDAFLERMTAGGWDPRAAVPIRLRLFPDESVALTDMERGMLWVELQRVGREAETATLFDDEEQKRIDAALDAVSA